MGTGLLEITFELLVALSLSATKNSPVTTVPDKHGSPAAAEVGIVDKGTLLVVDKLEVDGSAPFQFNSRRVHINDCLAYCLDSCKPSATKWLLVNQHIETPPN